MTYCVRRISDKGLWIFNPFPLGESPILAWVISGIQNTTFSIRLYDLRKDPISFPTPSVMQCAPLEEMCETRSNPEYHTRYISRMTPRLFCTLEYLAIKTLGQKERSFFLSFRLPSSQQSSIFISFIPRPRMQSQKQKGSLAD